LRIFATFALKKTARLYSLLLLAVFIFSKTTPSYSQSCDSLKFCAFKAITITSTMGKGAQYVEVDTSWRIRDIDTALTFEAWLKPQPQPGKRIYVGGLWGPNKDNNDVWVVYIENTTIYFVLNKDGSYKGDADNTVVSANVPDLYTRGWVHLGCIWDAVSTEGRIYVDGIEVARASNAAYPVDILHHQSNEQVPLEIGSCNSLFDDSTRYRSFLGQIDEVRLWRRALSPIEIRCQRNKSLEGNEPGLEIYYRANDSSYVFDLCDATGHGHIGRLRGGARMYPSDRTVPATFSMSPPTLNATLVCVDDTSFTFTLTDTSFCGNSVYPVFYGGAAALYSITPASFNLQQNQPITFTVSIKNANITGDISTYLYFINYNRCGDYIYTLLNVNRSTELQYSQSQLKLDTLYVGCTEQTYSEDSIQICNKSTRPLQISSAQLKNPKFSWRPGSGQPNLPITLQPGQCWKIVVQMDVNDTTQTLYDTLRIVSDDKCPGSGFIPIEGRTQDVIVLLTPDAKKQIKRMDFEAVCPGQISNVQTYQYRDLLFSENIYIDTIIFTNPAFFGRKIDFPLLLKYRTAYLPEFVRFRPPAPGPFTGQLQVVCHYKGCTIVKTIDLTGTGISVDVKFTTPNVVFGNVSIGKTGAQTASVLCTGADPRKMSAYLKVGDVFSITANRSFTINPGQTIQIGLQFRPREPITYVDTLCIFDEQCYGTLCIPITGTGVFEELSFTPSFVNIENVIGCQCAEDSVQVKNLTGAAINITGDALNDPSGKYTLLDHIPTGAFASGQTFWYHVKYCPDDQNNDRADRSYITINLAGGTSYQILLQGTSIVPKLSITKLTTYGLVEVGWQKLDSILIENITSVPVHIASIAVPAGYTLMSSTPAVPTWLAPRDSMWAYIQFAPSAQTTFQGFVTATIDSPCTRLQTGTVSGKGQVVKLEVPITLINYGLVRPCDCVDREIPLTNKSNFIPITIDSLTIIAGGLPSANPSVYSWRSKLTGKTTAPFDIPPNSTDTIVISFCPNVPAIPQNAVLNAQLMIKARTPGWTQVFTTTLSGRREMNFQTGNNIIGFPATRVDTNAAPGIVKIVIPNAFTNPSGDSVIFTGFAFVPDDNVFSAQECSGTPPPWIRHRGDTLCFRIDFRPRAPKKYEARLHLFTTYPCDYTDTSIYVFGEGFAPYFGMQVAFDTSRIGQDTFHITTCDTLTVPIMSTRDLPQDLIDITFRINYDSLALRLLDITSPFTPTATITDTGDGARAYLKNAVKVKAGYIAYARFLPRGIAGQSAISIDDIDFESDALVFFKIVAAGDKGVVIIDDPEIAISGLTDFDTVNIRNCKDLPVVVRNPGQVPIRFDSLSTLPPNHYVVSSDKPYPLMLAPGDSIMLTVRFCPRMEGWTDTAMFSYSNLPCPINDTGRIRSYGYAPPFPLALVLDANIGIVDTVGGTIGDTIEVPVLIDRDMPQTPIDFRYDLNYDKYALEYLSARSRYTTPNVSVTSQGISMELPGCDSVMKGELARAKFLVLVPDSVISPIYVIPGKFTSDSIFFIKPIPTGDTGAVKIDPKCGITSLNVVGGTNSISAPRPNPTTGLVELEVEFFEDVAPKLLIYDVQGKEALAVLDGTTQMKGGRYKLSFDLSHLADGSYVLTFDAGIFHATKKIIVTKR
jgi:hypothetical protein